MAKRSFAALPLAVAISACALLPHGGSAVPLRVMSYNIRSGNGNLDSTAAAIRAQAPDIVGLQEVDVHWADRSAFADQATDLGQKLGMQVRFAHIYNIVAADPGPPREFGVALLSRFPITGFRNDTITRLSTQDSNPVPRPAPGLLDATIDLHGTPVRVFVTHLDYRRDPSVRERQTREMVAYIDSLSPATIVLGDLNATPDEPAIQPLRQRLRDAWTISAISADSGLTYPADHPTERIDYVLVSRRLRVRAARVPVTQASDHRPVVVDLVLER